MGFEDSEADAFIEPTPELGLTGGAADCLPLARPQPSSTCPKILALLTYPRKNRLRSQSRRPNKAAALPSPATSQRRQSPASLLSSNPTTRAQILRIRLNGTKLFGRCTLRPRNAAFRSMRRNYVSSWTVSLSLRTKTPSSMRAGGVLLDYPAEIFETEFRLTDTGVQWEIDLSAAGKITEKAIGKADQFNLDLVDTGWTDQQLSRWLERKARQQDITQPVLLEFVRRTLAYLIEKRALPLTALVRWKFILAKVIAQKISRYRQQASDDRYQKTLFGPEAAVETSFKFDFDFTPDGYAPHWHYAGHPFQFQKHYYAAIGELRNKGEEYECAKALDRMGKIKHWVRNLERRGFWLPLANTKFYPDFVSELTDGRILVVEHKGKVYATNDDSKEKCNVGDLWEEKSDGKALFLMTVVEKDKPGLFEQIAAKIN